MPREPEGTARTLFSNHPRGLWILTGTELWDRISFHGMQALLVLYMVDYLLLPEHVGDVAGFQPVRRAIESLTGPLSAQALAAQIFGLYVGLIYFAPILGGALGDRVIGRRAGVVAGGLLLTAGHFCMAFDATFLVALFLLIAGAGLLRGNLAPQVTALYPPSDPKQADAFQIFYVGINLGAFIAPLITGTLAVLYGWHFGFGFAGLGMLVGVALYCAGQRFLPREARGPARVGRSSPLTPADWRRIAALGVLFLVAVCFWTAQTQVWNMYNLWVRDRINLTIGTFTLPVPWLQSLDGVAPILAMPAVLGLWRRQALRGVEPDALGKLARGCLIFGAGTAFLAIASWVAGAGKASLAWPLAFHLTSNCGWLYFAPTVEAIFAAAAPAGIRGALMGANLAAVFFASLISGRLGGLYEQLPPAVFWFMHAGIVAAAGIGVLILRRPLHQLLAAR